MKYIGEKDKPVPASEESSIQERILEFSHEKLDYFLNYKTYWELIEGTMYNLKVGNSQFVIPLSHYIMIGDEFGETDWILVDELVSRGLDVTMLDIELKKWYNLLPTVVSVEMKSFFWPNTKHIIPIQDNGHVVLVADKDQYQKMNGRAIDAYISL